LRPNHAHQQAVEIPQEVFGDVDVFVTEVLQFGAVLVVACRRRKRSARAVLSGVGAALLALLLFLNFMLEPSKHSPKPTTAAIANSTKLTTGSAFGTAPAPEAQPQLSAATNFRQPVQIQQLSTGEVGRKSVPQAEPKSKTAKTRVRAQDITSARRYDRSAYSSYARDASYFAAKSRHGPE
jgi:hypothetical protein